MPLRLLLAVAACLLVGCTADEAAPAITQPIETGSCGEVERVPPQGGAHLLEGADPPVPYNSTPPTSGWHRSGGFGIGVVGQTEALSEPEQVSVLEAGGAVVTYNALELQDVNALEETASIRFPGRLAVTPYDRLGEGEVAFTAWGVLQRCQGVDLEALEAFVTAYADPSPASPGEH